MDIQGAEWQAIRGMSDLLKRQQCVKIMTEFWPFGLNKCGINSEKYIEWLLRHGFTLHEISERNKKLKPITSPEFFKKYSFDKDRFTNLLCIRKNNQENLT